MEPIPPPVFYPPTAAVAAMERVGGANRGPARGPNNRRGSNPRRIVPVPVVAPAPVNIPVSPVSPDRSVRVSTPPTVDRETFRLICNEDGDEVIGVRNTPRPMGTLE